MYLDDFDRNHKNGANRFIDFWKKVSDEKSSIKIIENSEDNPKMYTLEYNKEDDKEYVSLIDYGVTFFFPLYLSNKNYTINFSDDITEDNLKPLFKLLNNKKNFHIV